MQIEIDRIEVGIPKFQWLLGRMSDLEFKKDHWDIYCILASEGYDKESYLDELDERYGKYLFLPILVEQYQDPEGNPRFKIKDGHRRLAVLSQRRGKSKVECELYQNGWTKEHWEYGRLIDLKLEAGMIEDIFPQKPTIKGDPPYNMWFIEEGKRKHIDSFLIHALYKIPYILKNSTGFEARGDNYIPVKYPRHQELLLGFGKHEPIAKKYGTHPLNSYLVGHFASGPNADLDPLVQEYGRFVRIQQYFLSGCWGKPVLHYKHNGIPTVKEQIYQNNYGVQLLFKLGILKEDTLIYFADQSADKPCEMHKYFNLFKGKDCLEEYYEWLPTYFRECRSDHFNMPIEDVIKMIPKRGD